MPRVKRGRVRRREAEEAARARERATTPTRASCTAPRRNRSTRRSNMRSSAAGAKKRDFRVCGSCGSTRAAREHGLTYGQFMNGLKHAGVTLDRKSLSSSPSRAQRRSARLPSSPGRR